MDPISPLLLAPLALLIGKSNQGTPIQIVALFTPLKVAQALLNPQVTEAAEKELRERAAVEGKWGKAQVYFLPITPFPPAAYFYECSTCRFFNYVPGGSSSCQIVEGIIEPYAWCALWLNFPQDKPLSWFSRAFSG